jgi:hypothetical protein
MQNEFNHQICKTKLAQFVCDDIVKLENQCNLYYHKEFLKTDIGQFWHFLKTKVF